MCPRRLRWARPTLGAPQACPAAVSCAVVAFASDTMPADLMLSHTSQVLPLCTLLSWLAAGDCSLCCTDLPGEGADTARCVPAGEAMYDQRLFNQDAGTAAGFGAEDSYNTYDKALFADRGAVARHRPSQKDLVDDEEAEKSFKPDKVRRHAA